MKLYFTPGACSLAPHIALREAELTFDLEQVDLAAKKTKSGADFTKVNPKGYVPALELDDGQILTEVAAVVQYVADLRPEANLMPEPGAFERYRVQEWLNFIATELHKSFGPLFSPNTPEAYQAILRERIAARFGFLDRQLAGKDYLMGSGFTVADAYCFTIVSWAKLFGIGLDDWPSLTAYMERVGARPRVRAALEAEGLLK
jgi:glutathione S-transferase